MILHYFNKKENIEKKIAEETYKAILKLSNKILNDNNFFIKKDYNSSFEIVSILLIIHIQKNITENYKNFKLINEILISTFISDLDESLRVKGIGDMSIGKYVKSYVKKFYFRLRKFKDNHINYNKDFFEEYFNNFDLIKKDSYQKAAFVFDHIYKDILSSNN